MLLIFQTLSLEVSLMIRSMLSYLFLLTALTIVGCSGGSAPVEVSSDFGNDVVKEVQWTYGDDTVVPIIAGQWDEVGSLTVSNDPTNIYFDLVLVDGWVTTETHLHVGDTFADFPQNKKGILIPGQFEYSTDHNPAVTTFSYTVPMGDWGVGDTIAFAFHLVVSLDGREETGWGGCIAFEGPRWGYWCQHEIEECQIELPDCLEDYSAKYYYPGTEGYWDVELFDVPAGYDVFDGIWPAWCIQQTVTASPNVEYDICLSSTLEDVPPNLAHIDWHAVAWILNHKHPNATIMDIQHAIWHYTDGFMPTDPEALAMIADADANSAGYWPGIGETMAVISFVNEEVQAIFLEIEIGCL